MKAGSAAIWGIGARGLSILLMLAFALQPQEVLSLWWWSDELELFWLALAFIGAASILAGYWVRGMDEVAVCVVGGITAVALGRVLVHLGVPVFAGAELSNTIPGQLKGAVLVIAGLLSIASLVKGWRYFRITLLAIFVVAVVVAANVGLFLALMR